MLRLFILIFSLIFVNSAFADNYTDSYTDSYVVKFDKEISFDTAQKLSRILLREKIIDRALTFFDIEKMVSFAQLSKNEARALVAKSIEIEFQDSIEEDTEKEIPFVHYTYTARAELLNEYNLIEYVQENISNHLLLFRLSEIEQASQESIEIIKTILKNYDKSKWQALLIREIEYIGVLNHLATLFYNDYDNTWQNPEEMRVNIEKYSSYITYSIPLSNSLAEIYIQLDKPQAGLSLLEKLETKTNLFTDYLKTIIGLRLGHIYLAEEDLNKIFPKIEKKHSLYPHFLILNGSIKQLKNETQEMCNFYKEACVYNICAPYFAVQKTCSP